MTTRVSVRNKLLAALPQAAYQRLAADFTTVTLTAGEVLNEPDVPNRYVHFPIDCAISVFMPVTGEKPIEVGLIGFEGMLCVSVALGMGDSFVRAEVQSTGTALRMATGVFQKKLRHCLPLQRELLRYAHSRLALVSQSVACHCFHRAEGRLACWLLMASDRVRPEEFHQDQDSIAAMLGLTRSTVSVCATGLRQRKLISYSRGKIRILDRAQLEAAACYCYQYGKGLTDLSDRVTQIQVVEEDR